MYKVALPTDNKKNKYMHLQQRLLAYNVIENPHNFGDANRLYWALQDKFDPNTKNTGMRAVNEFCEF